MGTIDPKQMHIPQPIRESDGAGATDLGPRDVMRDMENPDMLVPPITDAGLVPNLKFSFSDAHMQLNKGGWSREVTVRELPVAKTLAGVNMRLTPGGVRGASLASAGRMGVHDPGERPSDRGRFERP